MAIARDRRMNSGGVAKSRQCSVERDSAVQHNTRMEAGRQKVVVKTEEACGFGDQV
jgi:predicted SnoaL-like aldol condensation-catalyzing enzyme